MRTIAAFDFDGTLTFKDTLPPFLFFVRGPLFILDLLICLPTFVMFILGWKSRQKTKETLLGQTLRNESYSYCQEKGLQFSISQLDKLLRPNALDKIRWHQEQGHEVILISANLDLYLEPWGKKWKLNKVICSKVDSFSGLITGGLIGQNCWGEIKVKRLLEWAGPKENFILWAYGDSEGDKELLELADFPHYREKF